MKKIISFLLCLIMIFTLSATAFAADNEITVTGDFTICKDGSDLSAAADYLNRFIKDICGFELSVSDSISEDNCIILKTDASADNGYVIEADGGKIAITGSSLRNTVDGICAFLNIYGGITFYTADTIVKSKTEITIPDGTVYEYTPFFEMTETDWYSPCDIDYSLFNGLSGETYRNIPKELGGGAEYISSFAHTYTNQFCSKDKYFETEPECFAMSAGIRNKESLCLSNPRTLEIVTEEVLALLTEKHDPSAELQIVSLTQNDNIFFCTCPKCIGKYIHYGAISGVNLEFANAVARAVKEKGYDNVAIDTFAYMYTRSAPKNIVPEDNVIVRLCSLECCFSHALDDPSCPVNMNFAADIKDWSKICDRLYVWDYVTNFCNFIGIFPNFDVLQKNMQFFHEYNVKGVYEEGNYNMTATDTEFGELRSYLLTKLMQNPYCDIEAERSAFLSAYYGEGGKYIGEFIDIISESAASDHMSIYTAMKDTCSLSCAEIKKCDELWQKAKEASGEEFAEHIGNSELAWRYWKYCNNASEYMNIFTRSQTKAQFDEELASKDLNWYRECSDTKAFFLGILQKVRFVLSFVIYPVAVIKTIL